MLIDNYSVNMNDVKYYLQDHWQNMADPRVKDYPFVWEGPWAIITVMTLYLLFVLKIGPKMMENRKPLQLRGTMFVYNTVMVVINFYFFFEAIKWLDGGRQLANFKWPNGTDRSERTMAHIWSFYLYWLTKIFDLLDTIFFVLRKKYSQISTLHLYHHTSVPILGWLFIWNRWGSPAVNLFALLNSAVHVSMYSYYALAAFGPSIQKYLWWKRYITQIQIIQFSLLCVYGGFVYTFQENYPPFIYWLGLLQPVIFFVMFAQFYFKSYSNNKKTKKL